MIAVKMRNITVIVLLAMAQNLVGSIMIRIPKKVVPTAPSIAGHGILR
jgi:hypothetical protein